MFVDDRCESSRPYAARPGRRAVWVAAAMVLAVAAVSGCGGGGKNESAQTGTAPKKPAVAPGPVLGAYPDPQKVNCSHLANREHDTAAYDAAYTLAKHVKLPDASEKEVAGRLLYALNALC